MLVTKFAYLVRLIHYHPVWGVAYMEDFIGRLLSRRIRCPSARRNVAQGIFPDSTLHDLFLTSTRSTVKVGLLSKDNVEQVPFAYKLYKSSSKSNETLARGFKEAFCRVVPIDFVGVWWAELSSLG